MNDKIIAITGISGLVGGNLARALLANGYRVRGLIHQDSRAIKGLDIECISGDVRDIESLQRVFAGADVVYHLAAQISLEVAEDDDVEAVNVSGTRNVVTACLRRGVDRLIHLSSIQALEENYPDIRSGETDYRASPHGHLSYNHSKAAGEMEVRRGIAEGLNAVILKPTGIIGPYDFKPSYLGRAILTLAHGEIPALVEGGFDWIDVRDVVAVMIRVQQKAPSGSSYILSGHWRSVKVIAAQVAELMGAVAPRITVPLWTAYLGLPLMRLHARIHKREPLYTRASLDLLGSNRPLTNDLVRQALDFTPRPFDETIAAAV